MPRKVVMEIIERITFNSRITNMVKCSESFDSAVLRIAYAGPNRNGSSISREAFERCAETMYNKPVVANYIR